MDRLLAADETFLRRSFDVARSAVANGNHPFGAVLVSGLGQVLLEIENGFMPDRDMTGHAERLLATQASKKFAADVLAHCTIYSSAASNRSMGGHFLTRRCRIFPRLKRKSDPA